DPLPEQARLPRGHRARARRARRVRRDRPPGGVPGEQRARYRAVIGLIAGSGRLPLLFAEAAARAGQTVVAVAHEGETDPALKAAAWIKLGQLGRIVEVL